MAMNVHAKVDPRPYQYGNYFVSKKEILEDPKLKLIIRNAGFQKNDKIADIGSENGCVPAILSMFYDQLSFHLEDINPATLNDIEFNKVRNYYEKLSASTFNSDFTLHIGQQSQTLLPTDYFDHVMLNDVIHQAYYPDSLMSDIYRILKTDGKVLIGQYNNNGISEKNIQFFAQRNGFELLSKYQEGNYNLYIFQKSTKQASIQLNIHLAAIIGDKQLLSEYVQNDFHAVNQIDELGFTPLMYAAKYGHYDCVEYLTTNHAEVDFKSAIYPVTPLLLSIRNNHYEITKFLLNREAHVNQTFYGKSALMIAAENGNAEMVNLLVNHTADLNYSFEGRDVVYYAVQSGNLYLVKYFFTISKVKINKKDKVGRTLLSYAATSSNPGIIRYLIEDKKAKKNTMDKWGNKPSDYAWNRDVANYLTSNAG
jgi:ubiquinone/menaquinone biosynthesis C-methylase UbiE